VTDRAVQLYLIHWPVAFKSGDEPFPREAGKYDEVAIDDSVSISDTWKAVTKLSKARSVGVSNFSIEHVRLGLLLSSK
jgi:L-glyceraldehyde reductase